MLLLQLFIQSFSIAVIQANQCGFSSIFLHLPQTTAGGLQHHIGWTISLLRKNNPGQTAAVPSLFADLSKQNDPDFGERLIQTGKFQIAINWFRIFFISSMVTQDNFRSV